jgi:hypothetical protein
MTTTTDNDGNDSEKREADYAADQTAKAEAEDAARSAGQEHQHHVSVEEAIEVAQGAEQPADQAPMSGGGTAPSPAQQQTEQQRLAREAADIQAGRSVNTGDDEQAIAERERLRQQTTNPATTETTETAPGA